MGAANANYTLFSADEYDSGVMRTLPFYEQFHEETIHIIKTIKKEAAVWLDTGCGTGTLVEKAAFHFPRMRFICADPSGDMLRIARDKTAGVEHVQMLKPCKTLDIEMGDVRPDIITAIQSHHYLDAASKKKTIGKCYSLLADNGLFITFENTRPASKKGIEIGKEYWRMFQLEQGKDEAAVEKHIRRFDTEFFPITLDEHRALYENAGFTVVELFWFSYMQAGFYCIK